MKTLKTIARWIVLSSTDPAEVSLTIQGVLVYCIPTLMAAIGLAHFNIGQDQLTALFDASTGFIQAALSLVAKAMVAYGLARKLILTVKVHQQVTTPPQP